MPPPDKVPATVEEKGVKKKKTKEGDAKEEKRGDKKDRKDRKDKKEKSTKKEKSQTVWFLTSSFDMAGSQLILKHRRPLDLRNTAFLGWVYQV